MLIFLDIFRILVSINFDTISGVIIEKTLAAMKRNPKGIRFAQLRDVCDHFFGSPRSSGSSHVVYKMPWPEDPRVNIQNDNGMAKSYQVKQVLKAIERLQNETENQ